MQVCVLGLGYIGLPTASMLALAGHDVVGYDVSSAVVEALRAGADHVQEAPVRELVRDALASKRLRPTTQLEAARAYLICVPTPTHDHRPDLTYVAAASAAIAPLLEPGDLIVLESTVPPGTTERVICPALRAAGKNPDDYAIAHCPERVIPGAIVRELRENDRVVGGRKPGDAEAARALYASFTHGKIHLTDCTTAELVKVVENTFRDVNIAFANELALLSEELGVDVHETIALANNHPRVNILSPGPGVGGHCIPVDPHFLANANPFVTELIQTSRRINERMPNVVSRRVAEFVPPHEGRTVVLLGAAYKADVDDTRESPTEVVERLLVESGYRVVVSDPVANHWHAPLVAVDEAVRDADALVLMVGHSAFRGLDAATIGEAMRGRVLIDTRAFLDLRPWHAAGFATSVLGGRRHAQRTIDVGHDDVRIVATETKAAR